MKQKLLFAATFLFVLSVFSQQGIIGGNNTTIAENPWQISIRGTNNHHDIRHRNIHICGGSIIAPNWILTAAHCVTNPFTGTVINANEISIAAGITQRTDNINGQYRNVVEIIRYPSYNYSTLQNDVALLRLDANLNLNTDVLPILLTDSSSHASVGTIGRVTGWGNTVDGPVYNPSFLLQTLDLPIISKTQANNLNTGNISVTNNMIPLYESGGGVAPGDSGGPLSVMKNGTRYLIGCSSWGEYPKDDKPTIYTDLYDYRNWIAGIVPLPSLTGNKTICRTSNTIFTLNNGNANSVVWSKSNNLEIVSSNNFQFVVRAKLNASGNGYISATFNGITLKKDVIVGIPPIDLVTFSNGADSGDYFCTSHTGNTYHIEPGNVPNTTYQYRLRKYPNLNVVYTSPTGRSYSDQVSYTPSQGWYEFQVRATNDCGTGPWVGYEVEYVDCSQGGGGEYRISPNPTSSTLTIEKNKDRRKETNNLYDKDDQPTYQLYDFYANILTRGDIRDITTINISNYKKGIYILKISFKDKSEIHKVIIE